jgi:hypothetical protein
MHPENILPHCSCSLCVHYWEHAIRTPVACRQATHQKAALVLPRLYKISHLQDVQGAVAGEEDGQDVTDGQWPFQGVADHLVVDCLDPAWEVRHGATLALREILSCQAASAAVVGPVDDAPSGTIQEILQIAVDMFVCMSIWHEHGVVQKRSAKLWVA